MTNAYQLLHIYLRE